MSIEEFPTELQGDVSRALSAHADEPDAASDATLHDTADSVCRYVYDLDLSAQDMVLGLKRACITVAAKSPDRLVRLQGAYDELLAECVRRYFEEQKRPKS